jgi:hypothetical protein
VLSISENEFLIELTNLKRITGIKKIENRANKINIPVEIDSLKMIAVSINSIRIKIIIFISFYLVRI